jgi:hypothetical protein
MPKIKKMKTSKPKLVQSYSYRTASEAEKQDACNGIGPAYLKNATKKLRLTSALLCFILNNIVLLNVSESGNIHDWDYSRGGHWMDKIQADCRFLCNLSIQCLFELYEDYYFFKSSIPWLLRVTCTTLSFILFLIRFSVCCFYFLMVATMGKFSYNYKEVS